MQTASDYQLLGLTCLELAIKTHDTKLFPLEELVRIGQGGFVPAQVVEMEARVVLLRRLVKEKVRGQRILVLK